MGEAQFVDLARCSGQVAAASGRNDKVARLADVVRAVSDDELGAAVTFLIGETPLGRVGVGWATITDALVAPAGVPTLAIREVADLIDALAAASGPGSVARRRALLADLFSRSVAEEQRFLVSILGGELRQGALEGVMVTAVARAEGVAVADLRRAAMMAGSLAAAAIIARRDGVAGLARLGLTPSVPVLPMLASPAADVATALEATGEASVEWKLDGARLQAHRRDGVVRLFTRNLNDVTERLSGVVALVASLPGGDLVLDGEVLGVADDGTPDRFQDTIGEFGSQGGQRGAGLRAFFFDVLYAGGGAVIDEPLRVRRELLVKVVPSEARLPSIVTSDPVHAQGFLDAAIAAGHEGVMVKALDAPYDAGRRGKAWLKVKPVHTLDLVVLAVEWGHGRRRGLLSNLHLGARGPAGTFVMVGKTFKGLTDELLRWQTARFQELAIGEDGHVVHVRPEQVVEVALDGVQRSSRYPGGVALRFARVRRYRDDKIAADADTIEQVIALGARDADPDDVG